MTEVTIHREGVAGRITLNRPPHNFVSVDFMRDLADAFNAGKIPNSMTDISYYNIKTMQAINHPNVQVNFDTGNITFYNTNTDAIAELKQCIDYVATVEVKDHNAELESWVFPALGEGKTDFPAFFKVLREHNYNGPVTIEVEGIKGIEWNADERKKAIEDSVAYLRGIESFE